MIKTLHIDNYALIDNIDIDFAVGFNIITGETGAGKSIIVGALSLLLGERADMRVVRDKSRKSIIEAVCVYPNNSRVLEVLKNNDLDIFSSNECIIRRELLVGGRSRAFVNDTPVTLPVLHDIAVHLVDIHSQHQNLLLASQEYQFQIIDTLADNSDLLAKYREALTAYRIALKQYTGTRELIKRTQADADFIAFQYQQLEEMGLVVGEDEELERERELLANLDEVRSVISEATEPLCGNQSNVLISLKSAVSAIENLALTLDEAQDKEEKFRLLAERLESARLEVADIAETLVNYQSSLDADPQRLKIVEERLAAIHSLENKHHVGSVDQLIELRDRLAEQLAALENGEEALAKLEMAARRAKKIAISFAEELSQRRIQTAAAFSQELRAKASTLGMPNLRCEITFTRGKLNSFGCDQIQFLFAFNKNQKLSPVGATASGGEISRLMLTIKSIVASRMQLPAVVFDEVDTGVSGDIAARMAEMMAEISAAMQIITITHLPAVAAMGECHFKVYKEDDDSSTITRVRKLTRDERRSEIAQMLSGNKDDVAALSAADSLLEHFRK